MEAFTRPGKARQRRAPRMYTAASRISGRCQRLLATAASKQGSFGLGLISWRQTGCEAVT